MEAQERRARREAAPSQVRRTATAGHQEEAVTFPVPSATGPCPGSPPASPDVAVAGAARVGAAQARVVVAAARSRVESRRPSAPVRARPEVARVPSCLPRAGQARRLVVVAKEGRLVPLGGPRTARGVPARKTTTDVEAGVPAPVQAVARRPRGAGPAGPCAARPRVTVPRHEAPRRATEAMVALADPCQDAKGDVGRRLATPTVEGGPTVLVAHQLQTCQRKPFRAVPIRLAGPVVGPHQETGATARGQA